MLMWSAAPLFVGPSERGSAVSDTSNSSQHDIDNCSDLDIT